MTTSLEGWRRRHEQGIGTLFRRRSTVQHWTNGSCMGLEVDSKAKALLELARLRQATRLKEHCCIGDFHGGVFECDHVSPFTKSGKNVYAEIMIVAQDWSSSDALSSCPPDRDRAELGYRPNLATNRNLDRLLDRHFRLRRAQCYLTNVFPFVKRGSMGAKIPSRDLLHCARTFTLPEIEIVDPKLVICLGLATFRALRSAAGHSGSWSLKLGKAIGTPFSIGKASAHCVAHTGARGTNNRGREQVEKDWEHLARSHRSRSTPPSPNLHRQRTGI